MLPDRVIQARPFGIGRVALSEIRKAPPWRALGVTRHDLEAHHDVAAFRSLTHIVAHHIRGVSAISGLFETDVATVACRGYSGNGAGLPYFERRRGIA